MSSHVCNQKDSPGYLRAFHSGIYQSVKHSTCGGPPRRTPAPSSLTPDSADAGRPSGGYHTSYVFTSKQASFRPHCVQTKANRSFPLGGHRELTHQPLGFCCSQLPTRPPPAVDPTSSRLVSSRRVLFQAVETCWTKHPWAIEPCSINQPCAAEMLAVDYGLGVTSTGRQASLPGWAGGRAGWVAVESASLW